MSLRVLGIDVDEDLLHRWRRWLAPDVQPFFVEDATRCPTGADGKELTPELRDTYKVWKLDRSLRMVWLTESAFHALSRSDRASLVSAQARLGRGNVPTVRAWSALLGRSRLREQADGRRFVWWPSLLADRAEEVLARAICAEGVASRHAEVPSETWRRCRAVLPGAKALAGTFPASSGANCFGTVMAAAGAADARDQWMLQEPFNAWLAAACRPGSAGDDAAGTVLVWRDTDGVPVHAAVTLGDGWALEKPSQAWSTPRTVLTVEEVKRLNRAPGQRLERHHI